MKTRQESMLLDFWEDLKGNERIVGQTMRARLVVFFAVLWVFFFYLLLFT